MAQETSTPRLTALTVGPGPAWGATVEATLAPVGIDVVVARDRDEMLRALRERTFDVAIVALAGSPEARALPALLAEAAPALLIVATADEAGAPLARVAALARDAARRALVRLANHLAHDLNNPLGGLKLYVRLLERSIAQGKSDEAADLAGKVGRAVDQIADILMEIRRYDRLPPAERAGMRLDELLELCLAPPVGGGRGT